MIKENIYVAINKNDEIQWVIGSSSKTRYFRTDKYLKRAVEYHNKYYPEDIWKIRKCVILEDKPQESEKTWQENPEPKGGGYDKCPICVNRNKNCQFGSLDCHFEEQIDE